MNQSELIRKVGSSMYRQVNNIGYTTSVCWDKAIVRYIGIYFR